MSKKVIEHGELVTVMVSVVAVGLRPRGLSDADIRKGLLEMLEVVKASVSTSDLSVGDMVHFSVYWNGKFEVTPPEDRSKLS